jgi:hypothetical protein
MNLRPQNKEELFNLRHASLRNVIERTFGILKQRFRILLLAPEYHLKLQIRIPLALAAIHNFICLHDLTSRDEEVNADEIEGNEAHGLAFGGGPEPLDGVLDEDESAKAWRDGIAEEMWYDYQQVLLEHGEVNAGSDGSLSEVGDGDGHETRSEEEEEEGDGDQEQ